MPKTLTQEQCIEKCKKVHPEYNYDNTIFINTRTKIKVICKIHGEFEVLYFNHLKGHKCKQCQTYGRLTNEECISDFIKVFGNKYCYDKVDYINDYTKVIVICKIHGDFQISPNHHKNGKGCPKCANKYITTEECINSFIIKHHDLYDYSKVVYKYSNSNVEIICKKCNLIFNQTPNDHLAGNGCPICKSSKGERRILNWLTQNNINYITQKRFRDCRNINPLPFDFYLPDHNMCIEFDGKQHFEIINRSKNKQKNISQFQQTQLHDEIKNNFCIKNNIKLIRISYNKINNIELILESELYGKVS